VGSFFKTLKYEEVYLCEYETMIADVMHGVSYFVEKVHNVKALRSALDYCSPEELEGLSVMKQRGKEGISPSSPDWFYPNIEVQPIT
jgi:hypothetical protein